MSFINTKSVLDAVTEKLEALVFPEESVLAGESVFERVDVYDIPRLEVALKDLLNFKNRICLIVPLNETYVPETKGGMIHTRKSQQFLFIVSDKDYMPGKPSYFGDATRPGVLVMKDLVIEALLGASLDLAHVVMSPVDGEGLRVAESEKALQQSREGYRLRMETPMGEVKAPIQRGRSIGR